MNNIAAFANVGYYDRKKMREYIRGSPHIKHAVLRALYGRLVVDVYNAARFFVSRPTVLDIGAGDGSATLAFCELGASTTVVDISETRLEALKTRCSSFANDLTVYCGSICDVIKELLDKKCQYDIIVANSFLHHIPDYLDLIRQCSRILSTQGQFFSFQDPIKYASLGRFSSIFAKTSYFSWRIFQGDVIAGIQRRVRRSRGIYREDCSQDNIEYHVVRGGVDQDAIVELFRELSFECRLIPYFSTQSQFWQYVGSALKIYNTFSIIARKKSS